MRIDKIWRTGAKSGEIRGLKHSAMHAYTHYVKGAITVIIIEVYVG